MISPFAALLRHELLQIVRHGLLPFRQRVCDGGNILRRQLVANVRDFFRPALYCLRKGRHAHTAPQDMPQRLRAFGKLIEGHHLGNRHSYMVATQVKILDFLFPGLDFLGGVSLFREVRYLPGVESKRPLSPAKSVVYRLSAPAEALKGIGGAHLLPEQEVGYGPRVPCRAHLFHKVNAALACLSDMLEHRVCMETVHLHNVLFQRADYP